MAFETNGVLPAGFHDYTYDEFCKTFVEDFPTSQRRRMIAEALLEFSREVFAIGVPCEFWIDGSYATAKVNPNDADIILFFQYQHMVQLQPLWLYIHSTIFGRNGYCRRKRDDWILGL